MTGGRRAAVLGKPIAHSLSPVLHHAGYAAAGLTGWSYTAIECAEAELPDLVAGLGPEWAGLSLTMPLKEAALAVAGDASPVAAAVGAANTLVRRGRDLWYADNTDVAGMVAVLRAAGAGGTGVGGTGVGGTGVGGPGAGGTGVGGTGVGGPVVGGPVVGGPVVGGPGAGDAGVPEGASFTVLGAGGTARAALAAAAALRAGVVTVAARRPEAVEALRPVADRLGVPLVAAGWDAAPGLLGADVVVSTVPKGVADPLAATPGWGARTVYFDALYDPWPTPLAAAAAAAGRRTASGLDLLLAQALGQFEQFTGVPAPAAAMRAALVAARPAPAR